MANLLPSNDTLVTDHKKHPKIPTVNLSSLCNSGAKIASRSSEFISAFVYAGSSIQNAIQRAVRLVYPHLFIQPHKQRPKAVRPGRFRRLCFGSHSTLFPYELFPHKDRYCHTPKTVTFPPGSPCMSNCEVTEFQIACSFEDVYSPLQLLPSYQEPNSLRFCTHS